MLSVVGAFPPRHSLSPYLTGPSITLAERTKHPAPCSAEISEKTPGPWSNQCGPLPGSPVTERTGEGNETGTSCSRLSAGEAFGTAGRQIRVAHTSDDSDRHICAP